MSGLSNLPPGCGTLPGEEPEGPCAVCALPADQCVCPACPACGTSGDPACYGTAPNPVPARMSRTTARRMHGLRLTRAQVLGREEARLAVLRQRLLDQEQTVRDLRDNYEFSDSLADSPDPWR